MSEEYTYAPDDELPAGTERRERHGGGGIPYGEIHPDNDCWPSHSSGVEQRWFGELKPKLDDCDEVRETGGTMLTHAMSSYHAAVRLTGSDPHDEIPQCVRMAVDFAGWEVVYFDGYKVRVADPEGPLSG